MKHFLKFLAIVFVASGCKSSNEPSKPVYSGVPGVGTSFSMHILYYDTLGAIEREYYSDDSVTSHEAQWNGRSNVVMIDHEYGWVYETNGDLSIADAADGATPKWVRFPYGGGAGVTVPVIDDPSMFIATSIRFGGSDSTEIQGTPIPTRRIIIKDSTVLRGGPNPPQIITDSETRWFAPSLGLIVRSDKPAWTDPTLNARYGKSTSLLLHYNLK